MAKVNLTIEFDLSIDKEKDLFESVTSAMSDLQKVKISSCVANEEKKSAPIKDSNPPVKQEESKAEESKAGESKAEESDSKQEESKQETKKEDGGPSLQDIRVLISTKTLTHRAEIKAKLNELGASNATNLGEEHYIEFYQFLNSLS